MNPEHETVIIGAGIGGLGAAIGLKRAGLTDFIILERSAGIGGTWYNNHYPDVAVDVPGIVYQFSFAKNPDWSRTFPKGREVQQYIAGLVERYRLNNHLRLGHEVMAREWDEDNHLWRLTLADGRVITARFVITAVGAFVEPKVPDIAGLRGRKSTVHVRDRGLHGVKAAAANKIRHGPHEVFHVRRRHGIGQGYGVAVLEMRGRRILGGDHRDIDIPEHGGLPELGPDVFRKLGATVDIDVRHGGGALELHPVQQAHLHAARVDLRPTGQIQHAGELDLEAVCVLGQVGPGHRHLGGIQHLRRTCRYYRECRGEQDYQDASNHDSAAPMIRLVSPSVTGSEPVPGAQAACEPGVFRSRRFWQMALACSGEMATRGGM